MLIGIKRQGNSTTKSHIRQIQQLSARKVVEEGGYFNEKNEKYLKMN
jgi:hypothetical protein